MPFLFAFYMLIPQQNNTKPVRPAESINAKTEVFFMLELKNTKIMAVDHGYGNMKTANTVTPTGTKAYKTQVDSKDLLWLIAFTEGLICLCCHIFIF